MSQTQRIDKKSLEMIMDGEVEDNHSVMIKFYSSECYLCHGLAPIYKDISERYDDVLFYVYNMQDSGDLIEAKYGLDGVPTLCLVRTDGQQTRINIMPNPETPDKITWYYENEICEFIERYKYSKKEKSNGVT